MGNELRKMHYIASLAAEILEDGKFTYKEAIEKAKEIAEEMETFPKYGQAIKTKEDKLLQNKNTLL